MNDFAIANVLTARARLGECPTGDIVNAIVLAGEDRLLMERNSAGN